MRVRFEGDMEVLGLPPDSVSPSIAPPARPIRDSLQKWRSSDGPIIVAASGELQKSLNAAKPGCVISIEGNHTYDKRLIVRAVGAGADKPVTIVGNDKAVKFEGTDSGIHVEAGASGYRWQNLGLTAMHDNLGVFRFAEPPYGADYKAIQDLPTDFLFEKVSFRGSANQNNGYGMLGNCAGLTLVNCAFTEWHRAGQSSHGIVVNNCPGPIIIDSCYFNTAGIPIFFGGSSTLDIPGVVPADIFIENCQIGHNRQWTDGSDIERAYVFKHLIEVKNGIRGMIRGNLLGSVVTGKGVGGAASIQIKSSNQSGKTPWVRATDWTIEGNRMRDTSNGIWLANSDMFEPGEATSRVMIRGNRIEYSKTNPGEGSTGIHLSQGWGNPEVSDVEITSNYIRSMDESGSLIFIEGSNPHDPVVRNLVFQDNLVGATSYGIIGRDRVQPVGGWDRNEEI